MSPLHSGVQGFESPRLHSKGTQFSRWNIDVEYRRNEPLSVLNTSSHEQHIVAGGSKIIKLSNATPRGT